MMVPAEKYLPVGLMEWSEFVMKTEKYWKGIPVCLLSCRMGETEPSYQQGPCDLLVPVDQVLPVTKLEQPLAPYIKRIRD